MPFEQDWQMRCETTHQKGTELLLNQKAKPFALSEEGVRLKLQNLLS